MRRLMMGVLALAGVLLAVPGAGFAKEWKKVRIGTEGAYPPFNYFDANKNLVGFEIELGNELCKRMKVECSWVAQDWDGLIPALTAGKYDAIFASMTITDERRKQISFSDYYYTTPASFIVPKGSSISASTPEALRGKTVGTQSSTIHASLLEEKYRAVSPKLYPTQDEANLDLASGRLDAVLGDRIALMAFLADSEGACCRFAGQDIKIGDGVGVGFRKQDEDLRRMFNRAIAEVVKDGTFQKLSEKYFPGVALR